MRSLRRPLVGLRTSIRRWSSRPPLYQCQFQLQRQLAPQKPFRNRWFASTSFTDDDDDDDDDNDSEDGESFEDWLASTDDQDEEEEGPEPPPSLPEELLPLRLSAKEPFPAELQATIDAHVAFIQLHHDYHQSGTDRHFARDWKVDSRKSLKKKKKKELREGSHQLCDVTPFILMGAFQILTERIKAQPTGPLHNLLESDISVNWFFQASDRLMTQHHAEDYESPDYHYDKGMKKIGTPAHCKLLILQEALAMVLRPKLFKDDTYLPPHAWSRLLFAQPATSQDPTRILHQRIVQHLEQQQQQQQAPQKGSQRVVMMWNLASYVPPAKKIKDFSTVPPTKKIIKDDDYRKSFRMESEHLQMIVNMLQPYLQHWYPKNITKIFNFYSKGSGTRKNRTWTMLREDVDETNSYYYQENISSLPALLLDLLFLRLDENEQIKDQIHPLHTKQQLIYSSDRKKNKMKLVHPSKFSKDLVIPKYMDGLAEMEYIRVGPVVALVFLGPADLQEHMRKVVSQALKSDLRFDRKLVDQQGYTLLTATDLKKLRQALIGQKKKKKNQPVNETVVPENKNRNYTHRRLEDGTKSNYKSEYDKHQKAYDRTVGRERPNQKKNRKRLIHRIRRDWPGVQLGYPSSR